MFSTTLSLFIYIVVCYFFNLCYPFFDLRYSRGDIPMILLNNREK